MEHRDTEIVRDDINGSVREESHVTRGPAGAPISDSAQVVRSFNPSRRATELTYLVFGVIEGLLLIRLVLKLLGANPLAGFSKFIYGLTDVFMAPFRNLLPTIGSSSSGAVLETSVVIAIIVYALIGWALARLIVIVFFRNVTVSQRSSRGIGGPRPY
jgi:uncharacterized protein YggT (Ycf19 family)